MKKVESFILDYLEEFGEETPTALINVYRSRGAVEEGVVEIVYEGIAELLAAGLISLGEMRHTSYGAADMTMLDGADEGVLNTWKKGTIWDPNQRMWVWHRPKDYSPYVILGLTLGWRTLTPEEIAAEQKRIDEADDE